MRCSKARDRLSAYLLDELEPAARAEVEQHLAACPMCTAELEAVQRTIRAVDEALADVTPSPALERRVMAQVTATPLPRRVRQSRVPPVPIAEDEEERDMRRRTTAQLILAAAVILIVLVLWRVVPQRETGPVEEGLIAKGVDVERVNFEVTVYNDDLALVRDVCRLTRLQEGLNQVRFTDVPARIDATSVSLVSKTDPDGTEVLDQNYEHDLAAPEKILERYVDRKIETVTKTGDVGEGHLAGHDQGQLVLTTEPGGGQTSMVSRNRVSALTFDALPEGLLTRPTLVWNVHARRPGNHETVVSYLTGGMKWHCNYVLVTRPKMRADLKAWVTVENRSGASYPRAKLKLMAGDIHRVLREYEVRDLVVGFGVAKGAEGFTEKAFFEYHLYTLGRETDVLDNSVKQIELAAVQDIGTETQYVFEAGPKVAVYLKFKNEEKNGLGIPLPKGVVRVMQEDADGSLEFIGEDEIDHTPKDEEIEVLTGQAFDLVGERTVVRDETIGRDTRRRAIEVKLRNHKAAPVTITVRERIPHEFRITESSHPYEMVDARTAEFEIPVASHQETTLTYTRVDRLSGGAPIEPRRPVLPARAGLPRQS